MSEALEEAAETAQAYAEVFAPSPSVQIVLDDLAAWAAGLRDPQTAAGATLALARIFTMRSRQRRVARRGPRVVKGA